jgi:hypothetical protein
MRRKDFRESYLWIRSGLEMEHRGIAYEVVAGKRPATWHWTVHFSPQLTGQIIGKRQHAAEAARKVIDAAFQIPKSTHDRPASTRWTAGS